MILEVKRKRSRIGLNEKMDKNHLRTLLSFIADKQVEEFGIKVGYLLI